MAGGSPVASIGASIFATTVVSQGTFGAPSVLQQGMLGSQVLKKQPAAATWNLGETVEVSWAIRANHGGGYQYRLCRVDGDLPLTEECFQQMPLHFIGQSQIHYNDGTVGPLFNRTEVSTGTFPPNSTWAMNPIPRINNFANANDGPGNPACKGQGYGPGHTGAPLLACRQFESPACSPEDDAPENWKKHPGNPDFVYGIEGKCSGDFIGGVIVDHLVIPKDILPGEYVLGFRWDCEQSAQIWSSCADVYIQD